MVELVAETLVLITNYVAIDNSGNWYVRDWHDSDFRPARWSEIAYIMDTCGDVRSAWAEAIWQMVELLKSCSADENGGDNNV